MSDQLLATKLVPPPLRAHLVARPRLTALLDQGASRALTLVSATAGFGKTTLVNEWLQSRIEGKGLRTEQNKIRNSQSPVPSPQSSNLGPQHSAWLALDADDNAPMRLLRHVVGALQTVVPQWGQDVLTRLDSNPLESFQDIPDALLNELNALTAPAIIILDDYQLITDPQVHNAMGYVLEHLPAHVHLIVITRADPPLPIARLRARDQLVEIRAADLAFTASETAQFLNQVMGLHLTVEQINALEKRTEGWIAGLQLAALSLRGQTDVNAFIDNFTGNDRYIFDYLAEEVIGKLDTPTRAFLLSTSLLDRVCASLGQAVTGTDDAQSVLERLEHENLFTIALDTHREWYRYHHLFGELLRHELRQTRPAEIPTLHRRAAEWYETRDMYVEAIQHWLLAQEYPRAARLMDQNVVGSLERAEFKTLSHWLSALPESYRAQYPRLALAQVWAFMLTGDFETAEQQIVLAAQQLMDAADLAQLEALRALLIGLRGGDPDRLANARRASANAATGSDFTRGLAAMNLGTSYLFEGDLNAAYEALSQAETLVRGAGNRALAIIAASTRAEVDMLRGNLHHAAENLDRLARDLPAPNSHGPSPSSQVLVRLADLEREWNHLDRALEKLERVEQNIRDIIAAPFFYLTYAAVLRAHGNFESAQARLDQARSNAARFVVPIFQTQFSAEQALLYLAQGDLRAAETWFEKRGVHADMPVTFANEPCLLVFAEMLLARNRLEPARALLVRLEAATQSGGCVPHWLVTQILQAMLSARTGDLASAQSLLLSALERAEPEGYIRTFVDRGAALAELLAGLEIEGISVLSYRATLMAAFPEPTRAHISSVPSDFSRDALSERELEILKLVATGLSNNEIASQLVLTSGTVKWHVNNIFGKLDVHNRTQAVARAREIKLLA